MKKMTIKILITSLVILLTACNKDSDSTSEAAPFQTFRISDGIEVSLSVPTGFKITREHYGFVQVETFSRIRIDEKEQPFISYTTSLTKENLLKNKLQLVKLEQVNVQKALCKLYTLRHDIAGTYFEKLWLVSGDNLSSIVIEASYPEGSSSKHKAAIKQSLMSLTVATDQNKRLYTGLPFKFSDTPGYKIKQRFINSLVLESIKNESDEESLIVISHGTLEQHIENIQTLADHFLKNSKHYENVEIMTNKMTKLNNIPALATTAEVNIKNKPHKVYQIISYQKDQFLLIQAQSLSNNSTSLAEGVDKLLNYFKFK